LRSLPSLFHAPSLQMVPATYVAVRREVSTVLTTFRLPPVQQTLAITAVLATISTQRPAVQAMNCRRLAMTTNKKPVPKLEGTSMTTAATRPPPALRRCLTRALTTIKVGLTHMARDAADLLLTTL
jgi:hypothetical protein